MYYRITVLQYGFMYKPHYTITNGLLNRIAQIEKVRTQIDASYILPEREIEMHYRATVEATHSSTSIEGNPLNARQVAKVLADKKPLTRHQYAEIEIRNYKKALDFIDRRKTTDEMINTPDILTVHALITNELLPPEKIGAWRPWNVFIENEKEEVTYTAVDRDLLETEIDALLQWLRNKSYEIHPVIAAAIFHFQFVSIHPFSDGNGRTARALTTLYLGLRDYDFRGSLVLDSYYSTDKSGYYEALSLAKDYSGRKSADLNPWIDYFSDGFLVSAHVLAAEVLILSSIAGAQAPGKISRDDVDLLNYARQFGTIRLHEAEEILPDTPRRTIQRKLKRLVDDGYLAIEGNARNAYYRWKGKQRDDTY